MCKMINLINTIVILKNAIRANKQYFYLPYRKNIVNFLQILFSYGFISYVKKINKGNLLKIGLKYKKNGNLSFETIKIFSKASNSIFLNAAECSKITQGVGFFIISTTKGLKTNQECLKWHLGGKILCFLN